MTDSVFHKIFLITCTGFRLRQRHQTAVLHLNLWKLPHGRYSPAKHHVSEVHLIGYASYFNKKSNLSSKLISRSKKLTSEQASWIFLKNYLGILRPGSNCSQVWHLLENITAARNKFTTANNEWYTANNVIPTIHKIKSSAAINKCTTSNNKLLHNL